MAPMLSRSRSRSGSCCPCARRPAPARAGTVLIIVAGISALLASCALVFIERQRSDAEESQLIVQDVQARIMMVGALDYIEECSRIGWDTYPTGAVQANNIPAGSPTCKAHIETFGWIDVRNGAIGPLDQLGRPVQAAPVLAGATGVTAGWPQPGSVARCPMYVMQQPPYATQLTAAYNPIDTNPNDSAMSRYLLPILQFADPLPVGMTQPPVGASSGPVPLVQTPGQAAQPITALGAAGLNALYANWAEGDPSPRFQTYNKSWFRIYRDPVQPATFVITCGAGGTQGFRTYAEAVANRMQGLFDNDPLVFQTAADHEVRHWFRAEWSPYATDPTYHWYFNVTNNDWYNQFPPNASQSHRSPMNEHSMCGSFRWIQALLTEPTIW